MAETMMSVIPQRREVARKRIMQTRLHLAEMLLDGGDALYLCANKHYCSEVVGFASEICKAIGIERSRKWPHCIETDRGRLLVRHAKEIEQVQGLRFKSIKVDMFAVPAEDVDKDALTVELLSMLGDGTRIGAVNV